VDRLKQLPLWVTGRQDEPHLLEGGVRGGWTGAKGFEEGRPESKRAGGWVVRMLSGGYDEVKGLAERLRGDAGEVAG
jgi:hypothetical protein